WIPGRPRRSQVDVHREWIDARRAEGLTNVVELHRQLTERGFKGSYGSVWRYVSKRLGAAGKKHERLNAASPPVPPPPSAKHPPHGPGTCRASGLAGRRTGAPPSRRDSMRSASGARSSRPRWIWRTSSPI